MIKKRKTLFIIISIALILLSANCKNMKEKETQDSFVWESTVTAPYFYPVQVLGGGFYRNQQYIKEVPSGQQLVDIGWFESTGYNNSNYGLLPDSMDITWFSFVENKFYEGSFALPYDTIKKLFNTSIREGLTKRYRNYYEISIGMAPEGAVFIWVFGPNHNVDVGRFQAHEIPAIDLNKFLPSSHYWNDWTDREAAQKEFSNIVFTNNPSRLDNFKKNGLSLGLYDSYRKKYKIRITPNFADKKAILDEIMFSNFNAEEAVFSLNELQDTAFYLRSPLKEVLIRWTFGREMRYILIKMDESELFTIYKQIYEDDPNREVELRIDVNEKNDEVRAYFSQLGLEYCREFELEKSDIGIYPIDEYDRHWLTIFKDEYETKYPYNRKDGRSNRK